MSKTTTVTLTFLLSIIQKRKVDKKNGEDYLNNILVFFIRRILMALFQWNTALYSVGSDKIDAQHQKLVELLNALYEAMSKGKGNDVLGEILNELIDYTVVHFNTEETLFDKYNYPETANHKEEHKNFVNEVSQFKKEFDSGKAMVSIKLMTFLKDWLVKHIKGSDKQYSEFFKEKKVF